MIPRFGRAPAQFSMVVNIFMRNMDICCPLSIKHGLLQQHLQSMPMSYTERELLSTNVGGLLMAPSVQFVGLEKTKEPCTMGTREFIPLNFNLWSPLMDLWLIYMVQWKDEGMIVESWHYLDF